MMTWCRRGLLVGIAALVFTWSGSGDLRANDEGWIQLFNGRDLDGWKIKLTDHDLGDNFGNTFRVEEGLLKVRYDQYDKFNGKFGHIFYHEAFDNYVIRVEYRFVGEQATEGPGWAFRNSGIMLHGQAPETMRKEQEFPVSIEVQLLGGNGRDKRSTANLCTPGTHVVRDGQLWKPHCLNSTSPTFHGDQWVTVEVEVRGGQLIQHRVDGRVVLEYTDPQLDDSDADARKLIAERGGEKLLAGGFISLQAESHPVEFRKVELRKLSPVE